jgi:hypothetical protein
MLLANFLSFYDHSFVQDVGFPFKIRSKIEIKPNSDGSPRVGVSGLHSDVLCDHIGIKDERAEQISRVFLSTLVHLHNFWTHILRLSVCCAMAPWDQDAKVVVHAREMLA